MVTITTGKEKELKEWERGRYLDEVLEDGLKVLVGAVVEGIERFHALVEREPVVINPAVYCCSV